MRDSAFSMAVMRESPKKLVKLHTLAKTLRGQKVNVQGLQDKLLHVNDEVGLLKQSLSELTTVKEDLTSRGQELQKEYDRVSLLHSTLQGEIHSAIKKNVDAYTRSETFQRYFFQNYSSRFHSCKVKVQRLFLEVEATNLFVEALEYGVESSNDEGDHVGGIILRKMPLPLSHQ